MVLLSVASACSTRRPVASSRLADPEKAALMKRAKAPQSFGLTAYVSDEGAVFGGAFRQHQDHIGSLEFASPRNSTAPIVGINGNAVMMLIDSAAEESWLSPEAFRSMTAYALSGPGPFEKKASHVHDPAGGFAAVVPKFTLEKAHVENGVFYVRNASGPLDGLTRWETEPHLDGVLGADALRSFEFVRISLRGRRVIFSATTIYPYTANAMTAIPLYQGPGGLTTEATVNGEKVPLVIDIAGDFELAMNKSAAATVPQVTLGDVVFRQVEVVSGFELGLGEEMPIRIGRQLLERFDLVIVGRGRQLLLEKPSL